MKANNSEPEKFTSEKLYFLYSQRINKTKVRVKYNLMALRVLTFISAHHSVYSNRCFYQVINICRWQNIFSLKNIFRMICIDKNQLIMLQKCNRFCQKIWLFSNQPCKKTWPDREERMQFPDSAVQKSRQHSKSKKIVAQCYLSICPSIYLVCVCVCVCFQSTSVYFSDYLLSTSYPLSIFKQMYFQPIIKSVYLLSISNQ